MAAGNQTKKRLSELNSVPGPRNTLAGRQERVPSEPKPKRQKISPGIGQSPAQRNLENHIAVRESRGQIVQGPRPRGVHTVQQEFRIIERRVAISGARRPRRRSGHGRTSHEGSVSSVARDRDALAPDSDDDIPSPSRPNGKGQTPFISKAGSGSTANNQRRTAPYRQPEPGDTDELHGVPVSNLAAPSPPLPTARRTNMDPLNEPPPPAPINVDDSDGEKESERLRNAGMASTLSRRKEPSANWPPRLTIEHAVAFQRPFHEGDRGRYWYEYELGGTGITPKLQLHDRNGPAPEPKWLQIDPAKVYKLQFSKESCIVNVSRAITTSSTPRMVLKLGSSLEALALSRIIKKGGRGVEEVSTEYVENLFSNWQEKCCVPESPSTRDAPASASSNTATKPDSARSAPWNRQPRPLRTPRQLPEVQRGLKLKDGMQDGTQEHGSRARGESPEPPRLSPHVLESGRSTRSKAQSSGSLWNEQDLELLRQSRRSVANTRTRVRSPSPERWSRVHTEWVKSWNRSLVYPFTGKNRQTVDREDIRRLDESEFLNDNLINFALRFQQHQLETSDSDVRHRVHFMNSFFYANLTKGKAKGIDYDAVKSWTSKVDLFGFDYIVVPVNEKFHWYVAIICNPWRLLPEEHQKPRGDEVVITQEVTIVDSDDSKTASSPLSHDLQHDIGHLTIEDSGDGSRSKTLTSQVDDRDIAADRHDSSVEEVLPAAESSDKATKAKPAKSGRWKLSPYEARIVTLDSLGSPHSRTCTSLRDYLCEEAQCRKGVTLDIPTPFGSTAKYIPQQRNPFDCGLYLIGFVKEFLANPDNFISTILQKEEPSWKINAPNLRQDLRETIFRLHAEQPPEKSKKRKQGPSTPVDGAKRQAPSSSARSDGPQREIRLEMERSSVPNTPETATPQQEMSPTTDVNHETQISQTPRAVVNVPSSTNTPLSTPAASASTKAQTKVEGQPSTPEPVALRVSVPETPQPPRSAPEAPIVLDDTPEKSIEESRAPRAWKTPTPVERPQVRPTEDAKLPEKVDTTEDASMGAPESQQFTRSQFYLPSQAESSDSAPELVQYRGPRKEAKIQVGPTSSKPVNLVDDDDDEDDARRASTPSTKTILPIDLDSPSMGHVPPLRGSSVSEAGPSVPTRSRSTVDLTEDEVTEVRKVAKTPVQEESRARSRSEETPARDSSSGFLSKLPFARYLGASQK